MHGLASLSDNEKRVVGALANDSEPKHERNVCGEAESQQQTVGGVLCPVRVTDVQFDLVFFGGSSNVNSE